MADKIKITEMTEHVTCNEQGVFSRCKILGEKSKNGKIYEHRVREAAKSKYNGVTVYLNHNPTMGRPQKAPRPYEERVGYFTNVSNEQDGLYGDFHLNPHHPMAECIRWDAQHNASGVGFSHSIEGDFNAKTKMVENIDALYGVDLVADPASSMSMLEQTDRTEPVAAPVDVEKLITDHIQKATGPILEQLTALEKKSKVEKPVAVIPAVGTRVTPSVTYEEWIHRSRLHQYAIH